MDGASGQTEDRMIEQLARSIRDLLADRAQSKSLLVAVDGLGGSGKSTLAAR